MKINNDKNVIYGSNLQQVNLFNELMNYDDILE